MSAIIIEVSDDWGMIIPTIKADMHRALTTPNSVHINIMSLHLLSPRYSYEVATLTEEKTEAEREDLVQGGIASKGWHWDGHPGFWPQTLGYMA